MLRARPRSEQVHQARYRLIEAVRNLATGPTDVKARLYRAWPEILLVPAAVLSDEERKRLVSIKRRMTSKRSLSKSQAAIEATLYRMRLKTGPPLRKMSGASSPT